MIPNTTNTTTAHTYYSMSEHVTMMNNMNTNTISNRR